MSYCIWTEEDAITTAQMLTRTQENLPAARLVLLTNERRSTEMMRALGHESYTLNENTFVDPTEFPIASCDREICYDAVYVARLEKIKRLKLMTNLRSGVVLSDQDYPEKTVQEHRGMLPKISFPNFSTDGYQRFQGAPYHKWFQTAGCGLCLSEAEGAMRASAQYALMGLPIVTTPSVGGRDHYFDAPHVFYADPTPEAVADAVEKALGAIPNLDPTEIRKHVMDIQSRDQKYCVKLVNRLFEETFPNHRPKTFGFADMMQRSSIVNYTVEEAFAPVP